MTLFIPDGFVFMKILANGFYGPSYLIKHESNGEQYISKYFMKNSIGKQEYIDHFVKIIKLSKKLRENFYQPFRLFHEEEEYFVGIRPFFSGLNLTTYVSSVETSTNLMYALWKVLVRVYRHLGKHQITPIFIKPSNIFIDNGKIAFVTDIYPPPMHFNPALHRPSPFDVGFLAPEFLNKDCNNYEKADSWALGTLLWFMIAKKLPWNTNNIVVMLRQIQKCQLEDSSKLPEIIRNIISQMVVLNPDERISLDLIAHSKSLLMPNPGANHEIKNEANKIPKIPTSNKELKIFKEPIRKSGITSVARREIFIPSFLNGKGVCNKGTRKRSFAKLTIHNRPKSNILCKTVKPTVDSGKNFESDGDIIDEREKIVTPPQTFHRVLSFD